MLKIIEYKIPANKAHLGSKSNNFVNIIIDKIHPTQKAIVHHKSKIEIHQCINNNNKEAIEIDLISLCPPKKLTKKVAPKDETININQIRKYSQIGYSTFKKIKN